MGGKWEYASLALGGWTPLIMNVGLIMPVGEQVKTAGLHTRV